MQKKVVFGQRVNGRLVRLSDQPVGRDARKKRAAPEVPRNEVIHDWQEMMEWVQSLKRSGGPKGSRKD